MKVPGSAQKMEPRESSKGAAFIAADCTHLACGGSARFSKLDQGNGSNVSNRGGREKSGN